MSRITEEQVFELEIGSGCLKEYVILGKHEDQAHDIVEIDPFYTQTVLNRDEGDQLRIQGFYRVTVKQAFADALSRLETITDRCLSHAEEHSDCPNN